MATLKDVAKASGLTVGTVSRVLNNRGYISDKTREKVYQVMKELNYQPNETARALSKQKSNTIGVILPNIEHPYFAKVLSRLEREAAKQGYRIMLFVSRYKEEREEQCIEMCKSERVTGVVLCSGSFETEKFEDLDFPLITLERSMDEGTSGIECDNYQGGALATELLIEKGCRKLMFIGVTCSSWRGLRHKNSSFLFIGGVSAGVDIHMPGDLREVAFRDICKNRNEENVVMVTDNRLFDSLEYYEYVRQALVDNPDVDGVFASSDVIGAYVLQACADLGIKVPEQLKIVGFDDVNIAQFTSPGLTTIHQPVEQMAELAVAAIAQIDEGKVVPTKTVFPVTLVERGTT